MASACFPIFRVFLFIADAKLEASIIYAIPVFRDFLFEGIKKNEVFLRLQPCIFSCKKF